AAPLDPPDLAVRANNAVLDMGLLPLIGKGLIAKSLHAHKILRVHPGSPLIACRLGSSLGQAMNSRITLRDLHGTRKDIKDVATHQGSPSSECDLRVALNQGQLGILAFRDVAGNAKQSCGTPVRTAHDRAFDRNPALMAGVPVSGERR